MIHPARTLTTAAALALAVLLTGGCKPANKPMASTQPMMASPSRMSSIKADFLRVNPQAVIGTVSEVSGDGPFVAVSGLPAGGVQKGAVMSFMDAEQTVVAVGSVSSVGPDGRASVKYDPQAGEGGRKPMVGDLALHFPDAAGSTANLPPSTMPMRGGMMMNP